MTRFGFFSYRLVESTQTVAAAWLASGRFPIAVYAEEQSAGRGRDGRSWIDTRGGLSLSFGTILALEKLPALLPLIVANLVCDVVQNLVGLAMQIKWPNDLYVGGRKLGGILLDAKTSAGRVELICGVGLNMNQSVFSPALRESASSLYGQTGRTYELVPFAWQLASELSALLDEKVLSNPENWQVAIHDRLCWVGKQVRLEVEQKTLEGTLEGIDAEGRILLRVDGKIQSATQGKLCLHP